MNPRSASRVHPVVAAALTASFVALLAGPCRAADADPDADARAAAQHWARGQRLAADGDREGALLELRQAYELVRSPAALLGIARLHAALDRPIESKRAVDRLLAFPGDLSRAKLEEALRLQSDQARRIARVRLAPNRDAALTIDARPVRDGMAELNPGRHVVTAAADGHAPVVRVVELEPGAFEELFLELPRTPGERAGELIVRSELPGADVLVDGHIVGVTPLAGPVPVAPGDREVVLARPGYRATPRVVTIRDGGATSVELTADVDPAAPPSETGRLAVRASEPDVSITLNGLPRGTYKEPLLVPKGQHQLKVERKGFEPVERVIDVPGAGETTVVATLAPTPATRAALSREAHARRRWGWIALGAGAATAVGATTFLVINEGKIGEAKQTLDAIEKTQRAGSGGACDPFLPMTDAAACARARSAAEDRVVTLDFRRVLGAATLGVGLGAIGMGLVHVLTGPAPTQYDLTDTKLPMARAPRPRVTLAPLIDVAGAPAGATLVGRF